MSLVPPGSDGPNATEFASTSAASPVRRADPLAAGELGRAIGVSATVAQVLMHRGFADVGDGQQHARARAFLEPRLADLTPPDAMRDRAAAADRLARAVRARERVAVFGDYDVDGTTSAAVVADILEALGGDVVALVASRFSGGYGFSEEALARVLETGARVLVTCDCGSSDHPRIASARARGIDVIVVDHHLVPAEPLPALAFLNPQRPECGFAYKHLTSAGLALSLGAAVRAALDRKLDLRPWLDLVALGTIADVAPLDGDNRRLVRAGLAQLSQGEARPGVQALREVARLRPGTTLGAMDVAFRLAPRLNAAGRLGDPSITLALLRARTVGEARALAAEIDALNERRKDVERAVTEAAIAQALAVYGERPTAGIVVAGDGWHRGVVGITAARLVDRFDVPVIAIGIEDGVGHGSCRAPEGFRLYDAVSACASSLVRFGGHHAAAGLTVRAERVEALRAGFDDAVRALAVTHGAVRTENPIDVVIDGATFVIPPARELAQLEPLGAGNEEPRFALPGARIERASVVGERHLKLALRVGRTPISAFGFDLGARLSEARGTLDLVGTLRPDSWRGGDAVELRIDSL
jgi:single-stranded-DNA-specific exonuclease